MIVFIPSRSLTHNLRRHLVQGVKAQRVRVKNVHWLVGD